MAHALERADKSTFLLPFKALFNDLNTTTDVHSTFVFLPCDDLEPVI